MHRARAWIAALALCACAFGALAAGHQTVCEWRDRQRVAPGRLIDVGGYRLHLRCSGVGAPTVVLEAGLGETAASWGWIVPDVSRETTVCVYDRQGRGWSEPAGGPQDGLDVARSLRALLERGHVQPPFVLVGHSSGAVYARTFASLYPGLVAGMVLLDGQPAEAFEGLPDYPAFYRRFRPLTVLLPTLARLGLGRLVFHDGFETLPADARDMQRLHYASVRHWRSLRDEVAMLPTALAQSRALASLGTRPLVIVTAGKGAQPEWRELQEKAATLSVNSRHRVAPYTHEELVSDEHGAAVSSQAISEVVDAVHRTHPLRPPTPPATALRRDAAAPRCSRPQKFVVATEDLAAPSPTAAPVLACTADVRPLTARHRR